MSKRNVYLALFLVVCMTFGLSVFGCGDDATTDPDDTEKVLKIGYTPPTLDKADFMGQFEEGMKRALDASGIKYELISRSPADHAAHSVQLQIVEDLITLGVDYMVIIPTSYEAQQGAYRLVNEADIPLVIGNYSDPFPADWGVEAISFVGYSHEDAGIAMANYVGDLYPAGTKMAIIFGEAGKVSTERGQKDMHIANGFDVVYEDYCDWNREKAFDAVERLLTAHPGVEVIIACSSAMAVGAFQAVEAAGLTGEVDIYGAGGTIEELDAILEGKLAAAWMRCPIDIGGGAAEAILLHHQGKAGQIKLSWNAPIYIIDSYDAILEYVNPVTYEGMGREWPPPRP